LRRLSIGMHQNGLDWCWSPGSGGLGPAKWSDKGGPPERKRGAPDADKGRGAVRIRWRGVGLRDGWGRGDGWVHGTHAGRARSPRPPALAGMAGGRWRMEAAGYGVDGDWGLGLGEGTAASADGPRWGPGGGGVTGSAGGARQGARDPWWENCRLGRHRRGTASNLSYKGYGGTDRGPTAARGPAGHRRRPSRGPSGAQAGTREEREAAGGETSACHWRWGRGQDPYIAAGARTGQMGPRGFLRRAGEIRQGIRQDRRGAQW